MKIKLNLRTNVDQVFAELDAYVDAIKAVAIPRALNELSDNASTVGVRAMAAEYGLPQNVIRKYVRQVRARVPGGVEARLEAFGRALPLVLFPHSPTTPARGKSRGKGVTVRIKGKAVFIKGGFIQRMPNGYVGIFVRGAYGGKSTKRPFIGTGEAFGVTFRYGKGRLPINEILTASPSTMFANRDTIEAMNARVEAQAPAVIARNIRFAASRI